TYTSAMGFSGTDTFTYTVTDLANAVSNPATVTVVVNRPTANPDVGTTDTAPPAPPPAAANDTDPDGNHQLDLTTGTTVAGPSHGSATVGSMGTVNYTPAAGFSGTDTFTYTIADSADAVSNPATVTVTVTAVLAPPTVGTPPTAPVAPPPTGGTGRSGFGVT